MALPDQPPTETLTKKSHSRRPQPPARELHRSGAMNRLGARVRDELAAVKRRRRRGRTGVRTGGQESGGRAGRKRLEEKAAEHADRGDQYRPFEPRTPLGAVGGGRRSQSAAGPQPGAAGRAAPAAEKTDGSAPRPAATAKNADRPARARADRVRAQC